MKRLTAIIAALALALSLAACGGPGEERLGVPVSGMPRTVVSL